ncbi:MAG: hypothetical protein JWL85_752 [Candidatus Saccharibacteria bacterium]|nr:hypothetical protein [Candidatus Saccharibacteria bacterium]
MEAQESLCDQVCKTPEERVCAFREEITMLDAEIALSRADGNTKVEALQEHRERAIAMLNSCRVLQFSVVMARTNQVTEAR